MSQDTSAFGPGREEKRAQFAEGGGAQKKNTVKILALVAALLLGVAGYLAVGGGGGAASAPGAAGALRAEGEGVSIPVSELGTQARFYDYQTASGKTVRFFAMRSSDGVYRAALDACDVCFAGKQGYSQDGDDMVCNKCGNRFHSAQINEVRGGCNPVGLERKVAGDQLRISARELEAGASYF